MLNTILTNLPLILGISSIVLSALVGILHLLHKDAVANDIQALEDAINKVAPPKA